MPHHNFNMIDFRPPFAVGDILLWGERSRTRDKTTGKASYLGYRTLMAEVVKISAEEVLLRVIACQAYQYARNYAVDDEIRRPVSRILDGQPKREWWECEDERNAAIKASQQQPTPQPAAPAAPKP